MRYHRLLRFFLIGLLFIIQLLFLLAIFRENMQSPWVSVFIIAISILILVSYIRAPIHHDKHLYDHILVSIGVPLGAISCYYLHTHFHLGTVFSAGIIGTAGSFVPILNKRSAYLQQLPAAIYCGAFVGMSSEGIANGFTFILAASICTAVLLVVSKSLFSGIGGKLGTLAFLGVSITYLIIFLIR
ncbi:hypothetical protein ACR79M_02755 [Sphingobacterium spiritivorum]|uniref:hypothetical protein n=1 Tax=Sphingobacterium TaxID=28453 RepID=UPI0025D089C8|nr:MULTISPECIES: hypothetical protein [unclassified Sphingobacterium]